MDSGGLNTNRDTDRVGITLRVEGNPSKRDYSILCTITQQSARIDTHTKKKKRCNTRTEVSIRQEQWVVFSASFHAIQQDLHIHIWSMASSVESGTAERNPRHGTKY